MFRRRHDVSAHADGRDVRDEDTEQDEDRQDETGQKEIHPLSVIK